MEGYDTVQRVCGVEETGSMRVEKLHEEKGTRCPLLDAVRMMGG